MLHKRWKPHKRAYRPIGRSDIDEQRKDWYERIRSFEEDANVLEREGDGRSVYAGRSGVRNSFEDIFSKWSRDNGVRDLGRRPRRDRDLGNNHIQAEDPRAVELDNYRYPRSLRAFMKRGSNADAWFKSALKGKLHGSQGQSSVEYALLSIAFLGLVLGIGVLMDLLSEGAVVSHAVSAASHGIQNAIGGSVDVFSF